jgi:hypothetical protein
LHALCDQIDEAQTRLDAVHSEKDGEVDWSEVLSSNSTSSIDSVSNIMEKSTLCLPHLCSEDSDIEHESDVPNTNQQEKEELVKENSSNEATETPISELHPMEKQESASTVDHPADNSMVVDPDATSSSSASSSVCIPTLSMTPSHCSVVVEIQRK